MPIAIDLTGNDRNIAAIHALAKERHDLVNVSEPTGLDASKPLNVGLPANPMEVLQFVTVVFGTAKAALEFLKLLREQMKANGAAVAASEAATGKPLGKIESGTSDQALHQIAGQ